MKLRRIQQILIILFLSFPLVFAEPVNKGAKIPFEIQGGFILLPVNFYKSMNFELVFSLSETNNSLNSNGIAKLNKAVGKNVYNWLYEDIAKSQPNLSDAQIRQKLQEKSDGKEALIKISGMKCDSFLFSAQDFFVAQNSKLPGDGCICIDSFNEVRNILIDYKNNFLIINAPLNGKNAIPLHKLKSKLLNAYYILAEFDGVLQPFVITASGTQTLIRDNNGENIIEGDNLDSILLDNNFLREIPRKIETDYIAEIRIGNIKEKIPVRKYNDKSIIYENDKSLGFASFYSSLGLPFFKDKCVQFDLENMMLYVW